MEPFDEAARDDVLSQIGVHDRRESAQDVEHFRVVEVVVLVGAREGLLFGLREGGGKKEEADRVRWEIFFFPFPFSVFNVLT